MEKQFGIPIVLFMFKRKDTTLKIIKRIGEIAPQKIYLIADAGRNEEEQKLVEECRRTVENAIDWHCEIVKNYAETNRGVFANIGMGALWVFEREEKAIFLEDDNLPEITFFDYCKECLDKYEKDNSIFWICGTNYLQKCFPAGNASVFKSKHLMPCGWASWSTKFTKYYDAEFSLAKKNGWDKTLKKKYKDKRLYIQQKRSVIGEIERKKATGKFRSWDYQTAFSIRMNDLWGIVPIYNQIKNVGVDVFSTHGGNSFDLEMTRRFCGIETFPLDTPLKLPAAEQLSTEFEDKIGKIILFPLKARIILSLRERLHLPANVRLRYAWKYIVHKHKG